MTRHLLASICVAALVSAACPVLARPVAIPDHVDLEQDGKCSADRYWQDPGARDPFAVSLAITCRGTSAGRHLAIARRVRERDAAAFRKLLDCGEARTVDLPGVGPVEARRCVDSLLGLVTTEMSLHSQGYVVSVSTAAVGQGPAENTLRLLIGASLRTDKPAIDSAALPPPPHRPDLASDASASASAALYQGLRYIRAGLFAEAGRVLGEALSRQDARTAPDTRMELLLLAGLTDSNLGHFDLAEQRFTQAEALLRSHAGLADAAILDRKRLAYVALDQLNQRDYKAALGSLDRLTLVSDSADPLLDPAVLMTLNETGRSGRPADSLAAAADANRDNELSQLVIDAQANWARSIVLLEEDKPDEALAALGRADHDIATLQGAHIVQQQILWLEARIERQRARLFAAKGNQPEALQAIDRAIADLMHAQADGETGPALADVEFDRAALLARDPASQPAAMAQFHQAVDELVSADVQGITPPAATADYLDLLIADNQAHPEGTAADRYFQTMQVLADPAIARQFVELQSLIAASPALAARKQEEQDLEREVTRLRFAAADAQATDPAKAAALSAQSDAAHAHLLDVQADLQKDQAYGAVSDRAASIADVQAVLRPGEAYLKVTQVRARYYAILIDRKGAAIYRLGQPAATIDDLAHGVRDSISGGNGQKINNFAVGGAYVLLQWLTGPVTARLMAGQSVITDLAGPMQQVPIAVLVADKASVAAYAISRKTAPLDYSKVDFVARHLSVSVALSPRSLIVARALAASAAPLPFIGFAQHEPAPQTAQIADGLVSVGSDCLVERKAIAALTRDLHPVSAAELDRAGHALGLGTVPSLTGAAFTDTAVMARTDLDQFQVLHFATHGLTEGQWGCATSPPGLVTSLGDGQSTANLSFDRIARLKLDANLVVLSACDTAAGVSLKLARASGQEEAGASLEGLVRAFLAANARAVLATYWPISDAGESQDLMADFYAQARSGTIGDALRKAQIAILSRPTASHPLFWGAFFIVGDSQKPLLSGAARAQVALNADSVSHR
jgi:CHAT domain-containing protein